MNYSKYINDIIKQYCEKIQFDFDKIKRIQIVTYDNIHEWDGKILPLDIDNDLYFELLLQEKIIQNLQSQNEDEKLYSESVILHELFHCQEMFNTSKYINHKTIYFHPPITTTYLFLLDAAVTQWSEYYAYFNTAKYYKKQINLKDSILKLEASLSVLKDEAETHSTVTLYNFMSKNFSSFIYKTLRLSAYYNYWHDDNYINEVKHYKYRPTYKPFYNYIINLIPYMEQLYNNYPNWISEDNFINFGKYLFNILESYNLCFSTNDLSDNFIFNKIK